MKLALIGYGKMGQAIADIARQRGHEVVCMIGKNNRYLLNQVSVDEVDIALEFSEPSAAYDNIHQCLSQGIAVISGTTGWLANKPAIEAYCRSVNGTLFYASNFSISVNIFFKINALLAQLMNQQNDYAIAIEEIHHTTKKDAPSGTAITLAETIVQHIPSKKQWVNHRSKNKADLPILSKRLPDVAGTHRVSYDSPWDGLAIEHVAHSRQSFALGAILVAEWIKKEGKVGILSMDDFLAFNH